MPRSRSRSRGRYSRSRSFSGSRSPSPEDGTRIHVADLGIDCSRKEIERVFEKFGPLFEVWLARNPPCFAFINYRHREDAEEAIREMSGKTLCGSRIRCSLALPRTRGRRLKRGYDPNLRCYTCGDRGHFSRDCDNHRRNVGFSRRSPSPRRRGGRFPSRERSRERRRRSRSRSRDRSRSRSRSRRRTRRDSRRSRSRSQSAEKSKKHQSLNSSNGEPARVSKSRSNSP